MFEDLKRNIEQEKKIIKDINSVHLQLRNENIDRNFYITSLKALLSELKILNNAIPSLLKQYAPIKHLSEEVI
jgi:hypothetical protein